MKQKIIAIIPALNEEKTVGAVLKKVKRYVDEIILVDDGSIDNTYNIGKEYAFVLKNEKNLGYGKSLNRGFRVAKERGATIIITLDADGQHLPEEIPLFIEPITKGEADIIVGRRPYRARIMETLFDSYAKKEIGVSDPLCGMKSYNIIVYDKIGFLENFESIGTQLTFLAYKKGFIIKEVPISLNKREDIPRFGRKIKANFKLYKAYSRIKKYLKDNSNDLAHGN